MAKSESIRSITFIGCGSSYCLSESAAFSCRLRSGLPAHALAAGDLMLNPERYSSILEDTLLIAPSRSGSTSEVVEAVRSLQDHGPIAVMALSCVSDSPLSTMANVSLELPWAFDHSVCQTRTVTNLYVANLMLTAFLGNDEVVIADIQKAIDQGESYMQRVESDIRNVADFAWTNAVVLADGELYGLASEGALALTEIAKVQAHSYHLLDVRHGPMVTVGSDTLVIAAITGNGSEHQRNLIRDIKGRGATIIAFADHADAVATEYVDLAVISDQSLDVAVQGIPFIFIPQIVALTSADRQGINPDQPDGLVAWVKL
ncbi:fructoselysine-6-P-deglycase FrlB-like protein [Paenibacillus shirakamiensis]|uniref:Fructoselysine-6-P-deglycase FrlB-like protein n=1 Tax=Paenibacillus shirakamiensis TaxID=1265935 RepID=A0ABS4JIB0_9BACL|nr:fructoselysine-6-P-deglycase FrlB-like protein [Paenibacillus shirakamiensis]